MPKRAKGWKTGKLPNEFGRKGYGYGLYLIRRGEAAASWFFRYSAMSAGRTVRREMGLGSALGPAALSIDEAREIAARHYREVKQGLDPVAARKATKVALVVAAAQTVTFKDAAERYIEQHRAGWKNEKHAEQWGSTLETYAYPTLGKLAVSAITTPLVTKVLDPIWIEKSETASRVRGRIAAVLDFSKARGWRSGDNPAAWKGALQNALPARSKIAKVKHRAALPYADLPGFWIELGDQPGIAAKALAFTILTAARTGETIGATWSEIDLDAGLWVISAERMKADREHRVPLSAAALAILREMEPLRVEGDFVFPGQWEGVGLSNMTMAAVLKRMGRKFTVHGFRSSFRDWAGDETSYPRDLIEAAMAHAVGDKAEQAYRRGAALKKRAGLMDSWATFCTTPPAERGKVVAMKGRQA